MAADDHQQICELVHRYALGIDTRDWAMFRSIFADEVAIDFSSYREQPVSTIRADDWVARVQPVFLGLAATQHAMFNPIVEIDGDVATCVMAMRAAHALEHGNDGAWFTIGGYYRDTFRRIDGAWRITGVTLVVLWRRGDESIMTTAARRGASARARTSAE